jgi:murein DD-endopeptidase MepM/ murein hydrolase activator NlpD
MKNIHFLLLLLAASPALFSQRLIEVSYAQDMKGNINFSCTNRAYCPYVVLVDFSTLENAGADHTLPYEAEVKPGTTRLFTLKKVNANDPIQIRYKSSYHKGCLQPAVNTDFTYLLPIAPGKSAQAYIIDNSTGNGSGTVGTGSSATVSGAGSTGSNSGTAGSSYTGSYGIRLRMHPGDTIYAARRGIVSDIDVSSSQNDAGVTSTDSWNYIEIFQADCSFAKYGILKKDGAFVKPGQTVEAGTPLGIIGGDKYGRGSDLRFDVSYFHDNTNTTIPLQFWTKKNGKGMLKQGVTYTSEHTAALIAQEKPKTPVKKSKGRPK